MIISISRRKKSPRSIMLKRIMKHLSNEKLEKSIVNNDNESFETEWDNIKSAISKELSNN